MRKLRPLPSDYDPSRVRALVRANQEEMAGALGLSLRQYQAYERREKDPPAMFVYALLWLAMEYTPTDEKPRYRASMRDEIEDMIRARNEDASDLV